MDDANTESYIDRENQWDEQWPLTGEQMRDPHVAGELGTEDEDTAFPGVVGTTDVIESVRDSEPYTPADDPPVLPGGREGIHVATGFGLGVEEEGAQDALPRGDEDIHDNVMLTLRQDSLASQYNWSVNVVQGVVRLRGAVASVDDAEHAMSVIGELPGVVDVVDDTVLDPTLG